MKLTYQPAQVNAAAQFIWDNNPAAPNFAKSATDIANQILNMAMRTMQEVLVEMKNDPDYWISSTGTGGWTIQFSMDWKDEISFDVLVDPAVGQRDYVKSSVWLEN